eukprot:6182791-Pleurochrysis_carterae.AAC.2
MDASGESVRNRTYCSAIDSCSRNSTSKGCSDQRAHPSFSFTASSKSAGTAKPAVSSSIAGSGPVEAQCRLDRTQSHERRVTSSETTWAGGPSAPRERASCRGLSEK